MRRVVLCSVAIACAVLIPITAATLWLVRSDRSDRAAGRAAVEQFQARTGSTGVTVFLVDGWSDCAIVEVSGPGDVGANIAMKKAGSRWITGRSTEEDDVEFDSDDIGSRKECLSLAGSSGEISNGGPPEQAEPG